MRVLVNAIGREVDEVFQGEETLTIKCPRCAGSFELTPELFLSALELLERQGE